jgi:hypothetical protein
MQGFVEPGWSASQALLEAATRAVINPTVLIDITDETGPESISFHGGLSELRRTASGKLQMDL